MIAWNTSNWSQSENVLSCLIKQNNKWFLAAIASPNIIMPKALSLLKIKQTSVNLTHLNNIRSILRIDSAFLHQQNELDKLPDTCSYVKDGKRKGLYSIYDAGTLHLTKYDDNRFENIKYYAPQAYLTACYPFVREYKILLSIVNTSDGLWKLTSGL